MVHFNTVVTFFAMDRAPVACFVFVETTVITVHVGVARLCTVPCFLFRSPSPLAVVLAFVVL